VRTFTGIFLQWMYFFSSFSAVRMQLFYSGISCIMSTFTVISLQLIYFYNCFSPVRILLQGFFAIVVLLYWVFFSARTFTAVSALSLLLQPFFAVNVLL
jgi:hypothetical protein